MAELKLESVAVRLCSLAEIMALRYAVLCAGRPCHEADFDGDDAGDTHHFGAFLAVPDDESANIGCASYMLTSWENRPAWQLRGMATRPDHAGQGVGTRLIQFAHATIREASPVRRLWCNARVPAIAFYERLGWRVASDEFIVGAYGPHRKMTAQL